MANAAAKKALAAKQQTNSTYFPVLLVLNIIHLSLHAFVSTGGFTARRIVVTITQWILTYLSFQGIVHDAQLGKLTGGGKKLTGGAWLDLLGVIVVSQFGYFMFGSVMDWLLIILPGGHRLVSMIWKNKDTDNGNKKPLTKEDEEARKLLEERRKKRAEKRRQKRA
mmetsp:Transcript_9040/g.13276  ORF Transcript_9040/g.13276 Transcript_9040/m.13276 type:complete len:166 (+) Transcript_9040:41-538(+)